MAKEYKSYREKLLDPRWQKKRLEIMQRADFKCEDCGAADKTLHVHHGYYEYGYEPWDYDNSSLHCLCEDCHETAQTTIRDIHWEIARCHPANLTDLLYAVVACKDDAALSAMRVAEGYGAELSLDGDEPQITGQDHPGVIKPVLRSRREIIAILKHRQKQDSTEQGSTDGTDAV